MCAAEHLRLPYLSAYLNSLGTNYQHGANFATGGSTIRRQNETIFEYGISPFSLDIQIVQFLQFKARTFDLYNQGHFHCLIVLNMLLQFLSSLVLVSFVCDFQPRHPQKEASFLDPRTSPRHFTHLILVRMIFLLVFES